MIFRLMKGLFPALPVLILCGCALAPGTSLLSSGKQSKPAEGNSASATAAVPPIRMKSQQYVLANGLTLVVHADPHATAVALAVWYHVGSKDEHSGEHGFARLFGRVMVDELRSGIGTGVQPLKAAGATHIGVRVTRDATEFHETLPRSALDLGLWIEAQHMRHGTRDVSWAALDAERQTMLNTLLRQHRQPRGGLRTIVAQMTYPAGHPYSWTPAGSAKDLAKVTPEEARDWMDRYFNPANATLVVAGDVSFAAVKALAERYFSGLPDGGRTGHITRWVARMHGERRRTLIEFSLQPRLYMVWNVPPAFTPDAARLQLAAAILGDGNNSLLFRRLVHKDQLATRVSVVVKKHEVGSQFVITIDLKPGASETLAERDTDKILATLIADGPSFRALERARMTLLGGIVRRLQSLSAQVRWLARSEIFANSSDAWRRQISVVRSADAQAVKNAVADWLSGGALSLYVVPKRARSAPGKASVLGLPPPGVGPPGHMHMPRLQALALPNGMVVLLAQRNTAPLVDFDLIFGGGFASDTGITNGTARLAFELLRGALAGENSPENRKLEDLGAQLNARVGPDAAVLHLSALRLHLVDALDAFARIVEHPAFTDAGVNQGKQQLLAAIAGQRNSLAGIFHRVLTPLIFGPNHPYAHAGLGQADLIRSIGRSDLLAYASRWIRPDNATLLVTGDVSLSTLKPLIQANFGHWRASPTPLTHVRIPRASTTDGGQINLVNRRGAAQSLVAVASVAPPPADIDEPAFRVAQAALCRHLTAALGMNEVALTDSASGVFCGLLPAARQQVFYVGARVPTDKTAAIMHTLRAQMKTVTSLGAKSIQAVKQAMILRMPAQIQTVSGLAARYVQMLTLGLSQNSIRHPVRTLENLTPEQVEQAADFFLHPSVARTWIVIGDRAKIQSSVRALDLGAVQAINRDGRPTPPGA